MTGNDETDPFTFLAESLPPVHSPGPGRRVLATGLAVIALLVAAAVLVAGLLIADKRAALERDLERRLQILAEGRAQVLAEWLQGNGQLAARIADSDLFRLFVTELAMADGDLSQLDRSSAVEAEPLARQLPYMTQMLSDFVRETGLLSAHVVGPRGVVYLTSSGAPELPAEQLAEARAVLARDSAHFGHIRAGGRTLAMDLYVPVFPAQLEAREGAPAAVLLLTTPVADKLAELLAPPPLAEAGEHLRLVQSSGSKLYEVRPGSPAPLAPLERTTLFDAEGAVPFARRLSGGQRVYSAGAAVPGTPWWILQEIDAGAAEAELNGFTGTVVALAALLTLGVAAALAAVWWRLAEGHSRALAEQFRRLALRLDRQQRFLTAINGAIADAIGLKDLDGRYRYVNAAFARMLGRPAGQIVGRTDAGLFGPANAERLSASDRRALSERRPLTEDTEVHIDAEARHLQVCKVPFVDESGEVTGLVAVARDVTELLEEQRKKARAVDQMVASLVRAVELRDPYLAGHSKRLGAIAAETARRLGLAREDCDTLEIAANLSQIGKLAIPRSLLTKSERLSETEIARMRGHIAHARRALEAIDFELPILETICQMHERLDGDGYPEGLRGEQIRLSARILGACDVFCARVAPRAYRQAISAEAALAVLREHPRRYDPEVVAALGAVVGSGAGASLLAEIDAA